MHFTKLLVFATVAGALLCGSLPAAVAAELEVVIKNTSEYTLEYHEHKEDWSDYPETIKPGTNASGIKLKETEDKAYIVYETKDGACQFKIEVGDFNSSKCTNVDPSASASGLDKCEAANESCTSDPCQCVYKVYTAN